MKKKIILTALLLAFCLTGCNSDQAVQKEIEQQKETMIVDKTEPVKEPESEVGPKISNVENWDVEKHIIELIVPDGYQLTSHAIDNNKIYYYCTKEIEMSNLVSSYVFCEFDMESSVSRVLFILNNETNSTWYISKMVAIDGYIYYMEENSDSWNLKQYNIANQKHSVIASNTKNSAFIPNLISDGTNVLWYEGEQLDEGRIAVSINSYSLKDDRTTYTCEQYPISLYSPYFTVVPIQDGFVYETIIDDRLCFCLYNKTDNTTERFALPKDMKVVKSVSDKNNIYWYDAMHGGVFYQLDKSTGEAVSLYKFDTSDGIQAIFSFKNKVFLTTYNKIYCYTDDVMACVYEITVDKRVILIPQDNNDGTLSFLEGDNCVIINMDV